MRSRRPGVLTAALAVARNELRELARQPGLYLFVPIIVLFCSVGMDQDAGMFSTYRILTAGYVAVSQSEIVAVFVALLLLAYGVEAMERDRSSRMAALQYALPARTASLLLGKFLALCVVALVPLAAVAAVLLLTIARPGGGGGAASPVPFLLVWGGLLLPGLLLWVLLVMALYTLTGHNRFRTYAFGGVALLLLMSGGTAGWAFNPFLTEALRWSDLAPLEMDRFPLLLSRALVLAAALFWGALAVYAFRRREPDPARFLGRLRPGAQAHSLLRLAPFAALPLALGVWLTVRVEDGRAGHARAAAEKNYWRRNLATWKGAPVPGVSAADLSLDLRPERRAFACRGTLTLVNFHPFPLRAVPVTPDLGWRDVRWTLDGAPAAPEDRAGLCVFTPPGGSLAPGATVRLGFSYDAPDPGPTRHGVGGGGDDGWEFVLPSALVMNSFSHSFVPQVGYDERLGVDEENRCDADDGTAARDPRREVRLPLFGSPTPIALRVSVTAPADFLVNGVGRRVSDTVRGGRRTVVWEAPRRPEAPVYDFNLVGGRGLAVRRGATAGTAVYYYPGHGYNVAEMAAALDASRRWYGEWFAPYRWRELKLTEFPDMAGYAQSFPTNISFGEGMGFLTRSGGARDATDAFTVTAHEAAHQWWGTLVVPADGPGGNVLSEGLAHFSAALLLEREKGPRARRQFLRTIEDEYVKGRSEDSELPLSRLTGEKKGDMVVTYCKGGWVFTMLGDGVMGRENLLRGLRAYVAKYRSGPDHPTVADLLATLRPFAPDGAAFDAFRGQWFDAVVLPEFRVTDAAARDAAPTPDAPRSRWAVTCRVANAGTGRVTVPVAVEGAGRRDRLVTTVGVTGGGPPAAVTLRPDFKPVRVVVDPDVTVLQIGRDDAAAAL